MRARSLATLTLLLAAVAVTGCDSNNDENEATLQGTVVNDVTSEPIEGAIIRIRGGAEEFQATTDAEGMYSAVYEFEDAQGDGGERSTNVTVEAFADGFQEGIDGSRVSIEVFAGGSRAVQQLRLLPVGVDPGTPGPGSGNTGTATLAGYVFDGADQEAVEGVRVVVQGRGADAETDAEGFFSVDVPEVVDGSSYNVRFTKAGFAPSEESVELFIDERTDIGTTIDAIVQVGPATVSGVVTDEVSGGGAEGLTVELVEAGVSDVTDRNGQYALTAPDVQGSRDYTLRISGPGFEAVEETVMLRADQPVTFSVDVLRVAAATVSGRVVNAETLRGVQGVRVVVDGRGVEATTDLNGAFELAVPAVRGTEDATLVLTKEDFERVAQDIELVAGEVTDVEVEFTRDNVNGSGPARSITLLERTEQNITVAGAGGVDEIAQLTFVVYDDEGRPVSNENAVDVTFALFLYDDDNPTEVEIPNLATLSAETVTTDESGRARVWVTSGTQSGAVQVEARFQEPATSPNPIISEPVVITISGGLPDDDFFSVVAEQPNFAPAATQTGLRQTITAYVGDRYGNPVVPGTAVYFTTNGGIVGGSAFTDVDGVATVDFLSTAITPQSGDSLGFARVEARTQGVGGEFINAFVRGGVLFSGNTRIKIQSDERVGEEYVIQFTVADGNGNPLGLGTTISVTAEGDNVEVVNGEYGPFGFEQDQGDGTTQFVTTIVPGDFDNDAFLQSFSISVTSPNGDREVEQGVGELIYEAPVDPAP